LVFTKNLAAFDAGFPVDPVNPVQMAERRARRVVVVNKTIN
jgi:hypothetical protein